MSLGMVERYDFVRPPLGSHEDMNNMSDDWSWPIRDDSFGNMMWRLGRTIGISETVLKDKMINVHSHTRILETLKPYQATTWSDQDLRALTLDLEPPWPTLNKSTINSPAYFMYPVNKVFMECLDKIVVIIIWWPTCPPEDGRRAVQLVKEHLKTAMPRRKNYHHHQEVNIRVEDQVYLQATPL